MQSTRMWVVGVVAAVALFGAFLLLRPARQEQLPEPERQARVPLPTRRAVTRRQFAAAADGGAHRLGNQESLAREAWQGARDVQDGAIDVPSGTESPPPTAARKGAKMTMNFSGSLAGSSDDGSNMEPILAEGLEFDAASGATRFGPHAELAYPDSGGVSAAEGTIGFWVRMEWDAELPPDGKTLAELRTETWENRLVIRMGPNFLGLLVATSDGVEQGVGSSLGWAAGEWHHVAAMWGDGQMSLYIDGVPRDQRPLNGSLDIPPDTPLYVGSTRSVAARDREGSVSLRSWQVFPTMLAPDEVAAQMADTSPPSQP
jgi:hypothetical protein